MSYSKLMDLLFENGFSGCCPHTKKLHFGAPALTKSSGCHSAGTHYVSIMLVIRLNKLKRHAITVI